MRAEREAVLELSLSFDAASDLFDALCESNQDEWSVEVENLYLDLYEALDDWEASCFAWRQCRFAVRRKGGARRDQSQEKLTE